MPRTKRKESETGIYHVVLRGINRQQIFEDDEDYNKFIEVLSDCKAKSGFKCPAYCLMGNHIHLLIKTGDEPLGQVFRRIGARYVYWYNFKYARSGHLFQDRYKSAAVEDEAYLLSAVRYIHNNPVKAGIVRGASSYRWSSERSYSGGKSSALVDTSFVLELFGGDLGEQVKNYRAFMKNDDDIRHLEYEQARLNDIQAKEIMMKICETSTKDGFQMLEEDKQISMIKLLHDEGLSIRQISRLTGKTVGVVRKYT